VPELLLTAGQLDNIFALFIDEISTDLRGLLAVIAIPEIQMPRGLAVEDPETFREAMIDRNREEVGEFVPVVRHGYVGLWTPVFA